MSLGKLSNDSELIVMNSAGMSPWQLFRPFLAMAVVVSAIVMVIGAWLGPFGLRTLHAWATEVRADLVTNIVQPGRFNAFERGLTFHIRERQPNGLLLGIFVDDRRSPKEHATFLAEYGTILKDERGTFLLLENGSVQRLEISEKERDPAVVHFDRYAFDLSQAPNTTQTTRNSARDRFIWDLIWPDANDPVYLAQSAHFRTEMHDRIFAPLYPLCFVILTYAYLGAPRTTRQSRTLALVGAIVVVSAVRLLGFAATVLSLRHPATLAMQYLVVLGASAWGLWAIGRGLVIEPPAWLLNAIATISEKLPRRAAATAT